MKSARNAGREWLWSRGMRSPRNRGFGRWGYWLLVLGLVAGYQQVGLLRTAADETPVPTEAEARGTPAPEQGGADSAGVDADGQAGDHAADSGGHEDPVAPVLLAIVLILFSAKVCGDLFERIKLPAVLGELFIGIVLGNFALLTGSHVFDFLQPPGAVHADADATQSDEAAAEVSTVLASHSIVPDPYDTGAILKMLAGIGVVLLLFEVGLESTVGEMMSVGVSSLAVAVLGVVAPMLLGWGAGWILIPEEGWETHAFLGATLSATSVGITARVLKDLGRSQQRESRIILGAAVIDDVLGLVILAVVSGVISQGSISPMGLAVFIAKAFGFLGGAVLVGNVIFTRPLFKAASHLNGHGLLVSAALVFCFVFSWLASQIGLAPIVGAFAAGLILEKAHYRELGQRENRQLEDALQPLVALLVPIFFVQMGIQVDLGSFRDPSVWGLAAAITGAAIVGKQVCAFGVRERGLNRVAVGLGMIPRGEVGLIFADQGRQLVNHLGEPVINTATFSAVVVMVMVTTMVTPPLLKWSLSKSSPPDAAAEGPAGSG